MSHKNYSAKPLDYVEPFKKKLKAQGIDVAAIERENAQVTKHVEHLEGLQVANSEILIATNIGDITDYGQLGQLSQLPNIGNTSPTVQDITEYNPIPKTKIVPKAPVSKTVVDNEVVVNKTPEEETVANETQETQERELTILDSIAGVAGLEALDEVSDISDIALTPEDSNKESL